MFVRFVVATASVAIISLTVAATPPKRTAADLFHEGYVRLQSEDAELASDLLEAGLTIAPNDVNGWQYLGVAQLKLEKVEQARVSFDKAAALARDPQTVAQINSYRLALNAPDFSISLNGLTEDELKFLQLTDQKKEYIAGDYRSRTQFSGKKYRITGTLESISYDPSENCTEFEGLAANSYTKETVNVITSPPFYVGLSRENGTACVDRKLHKRNDYSIENNFAALLGEHKKDKRISKFKVEVRTPPQLMDEGWLSSPGGWKHWTNKDIQTRCRSNGPFDKNAGKIPIKCVFRSVDHFSSYETAFSINPIANLVEKSSDRWNLSSDAQKISGSIDNVGDTASIEYDDLIEYKTLSLSIRVRANLRIERIE